MSSLEKPVGLLRRESLGYLPVLSLQVSQIPWMLGDPEQSVSIELLKLDKSSKVIFRFEGVRQLKIADIHPGTHCALEIVDVIANQLEAICYHVFNPEQDFTFSFYCRSFSIREEFLQPQS
jgi:hypothetical protein